MYKPNLYSRNFLTKTKTTFNASLVVVIVVMVTVVKVTERTAAADVDEAVESAARTLAELVVV